MAEIKINRKLNLTMEWETDRGTLHLFSIPVGKNVFDDNYMLFARAYSALYRNDLGAVSGPRIAAQLLRSEANVMEQPERYDRLIMEIRRLTTVFTPSHQGAGYENLPYFEAIKRKLIDDEDSGEIESAICFFTLVLWMTPKTRLPIVLGGLSLIWSAGTTSSTISDYQRSLPTLTKDENTGKKQTPQETSPLSIAS